MDSNMQEKTSQSMHGHKNSMTLNPGNSTIDTITTEDIIVGQQQLPQIPYKRNINNGHDES